MGNRTSSTSYQYPKTVTKTEYKLNSVAECIDIERIVKAKYFVVTFCLRYLLTYIRFKPKN
jgi:isoprenylcysteine carboxyl methyltransferase (ICMT) family protein YpbQ